MGVRLSVYRVNHSCDGHYLKERSVFPRRGERFFSFIAGFLGLLYGSLNLTALWVIFVGVGIGFAFSLAMMFFGLRAENAQQAADLSGMAQAVGYLLAASAPTTFGYLYDVTNSWTIPLFILFGGAVLLLLVGLGAGKNESIRVN